jgi:hypothetical protein
LFLVAERELDDGRQRRTQQALLRKLASMNERLNKLELLGG